MFAYLVWARKESLADLPLYPNYWGLSMLGALIFAWILANLAEVRILQEFLLIAILVAMAWTLLGTAVIRILALPILFLFFAVPFGTNLITPLQDFTSWFVIHALTLSHVPAVLDNHTISLPLGVWTVAETCSGIRFLLSSFVLGIFFSVLMYRSWLRRLAFLCASIVVPIVGNGLRAYGTILVAYHTNNKVAAGVDHIVYGGLFSIFIQLILIAIGLRWSEQSRPQEQITGGRSGTEILQINTGRSPGKAVFLLTAGLAAMMLLGSISATYLWKRAVAATQWALPPVMVSPPWQTAATSDMSWAPLWPGQDTQYGKSYEYQGERVDLHWALYSGREGIDLLTPSEAIANAQSWIVVGQDLRWANIGGRNVKVFRNLIQSGKTFRTVWSWYWVGGEHTADRARVRLLQAKARLLGEPSEVAVISVGTDTPRDISDDGQALQEFLLHTNFETSRATVPLREFQSADALIPSKE